MMKPVKHYLAAAVSSVLFVLILAGFVSIHHTAKAESIPEPQRYYTSIRINPGDTLWEIASDYRWEGQSRQEYIHDVMEMNHLSSDQITAGQYLMIYYYGTSAEQN